MSVLAWAGRLAGWLVFILCTVAAILATQAHAWTPVALLAVVATSGLALALAADRRIDDAKRRRQAQQVQAWAGAEIVATLDWVYWCAGLAVMGTLAAFGFTVAQVPSAGLRAVGVVIGACSGFGFAAALFMVIAATRAGYVLRLDARGIAYFRGETIPWRDVLALDLRLGIGGAVAGYFLVVELQPQAAGTRSGSREGASARRIPLAGVAVDRELLMHAARVIAWRAGVPLPSRGQAAWARVPA